MMWRITPAQTQIRAQETKADTQTYTQQTQAHTLIYQYTNIQIRTRTNTRTKSIEEQGQTNTARTYTIPEQGPTADAVWWTVGWHSAAPTCRARCTAAAARARQHACLSPWRHQAPIAPTAYAPRCPCWLPPAEGGRKKCVKTEYGKHKKGESACFKHKKGKICSPRANENIAQ